LLIFLQTILSIVHFSLDKTLHKQWVQVSFWKYQVFDEDDVFISNLWHHHMNVCLLTNFWQQFV
jgi:hypothetical protein